MSAAKQEMKSDRWWFALVRQHFLIPPRQLLTIPARPLATVPAFQIIHSLCFKMLSKRYGGISAQGGGQQTLDTAEGNTINFSFKSGVPGVRLWGGGWR